MLTLNEVETNVGNQSSSNVATSEVSDLSLISIVAAVFGTVLLLATLFLVIAFLFFCKSRLNSGNLDRQEESTSMVSLTDRTELNSAQIIENLSVHGTILKGKTTKTVSDSRGGPLITRHASEDIVC